MRLPCLGSAPSDMSARVIVCMLRDMRCSAFVHMSFWIPVENQSCHMSCVVMACHEWSFHLVFFQCDGSLKALPIVGRSAKEQPGKPGPAFGRPWHPVHWWHCSSSGCVDWGWHPTMAVGDHHRYSGPPAGGGACPREIGLPCPLSREEGIVGPCLGGCSPQQPEEVPGGFGLRHVVTVLEPIHGVEGADISSNLCSMGDVTMATHPHQHQMRGGSFQDGWLQECWGLLLGGHVLPDETFADGGGWDH